MVPSSWIEISINFIWIPDTKWNLAENICGRIYCIWFDIQSKWSIQFFQSIVNVSYLIKLSVPVTFCLVQIGQIIRIETNWVISEIKVSSTISWANKKWNNKNKYEQILKIKFTILCHKLSWSDDWFEIRQCIPNVDIDGRGRREHVKFQSESHPEEFTLYHNEIR